MTTVLAPLDDPTYTPKYPPDCGQVPAVVARWGPRSQLRWFTRFRSQLTHQPPKFWSAFHTQSLEHTGWCCGKCLESDDPSDWWDGPECCCNGYETETAT